MAPSVDPRKHARPHFLGVVIALIIVDYSQGQLTRQFPTLVNAALGRPITTIPSSSTCGQTTRNAYCQSSVNADSINRCIQGYCSQTCPDRSGPPPDSSIFIMLIATSAGTGVCVLADTINVRPGTPIGQYSTMISSAGPTCYLTPVQTPRLDSSGVVAFTITSWVWLDSQTKGTLLEKQSTNGSFLFSFQVGPIGLTFVYASVGGDSLSASADVPIPVRRWTHITLQVHDTSASFYINGPGTNLSANATVKLVGAISDGDGSFRIGQSQNGLSQFIGKIQELKFYSLTLTNREVAESFSGVLPTVRIQSECRCPAIYPRIKPGQTQYCIKNGDLPSTSDMTLRVSSDTHPLEYANDGDSNSMWISSIQSEVEMEVDLGDRYQVFYVILQFYSSFPKAVTFLKQNNENSSFEVWQYYADDCSHFGMANNGYLTAPNSVNCLQFGTNGAPVPYSLGSITFNLLASAPVARPGSSDFYNTPELHNFVSARKVRVKFEDHFYVTNLRHQYFAVYEFIVTAWCDCNGHASQCNRDSLPYTCACLNSSNTEGKQCERCKSLFNNKPYRKGDNVQDYPCLPCICNGHADSCVYNSTLDPFPESPDQGGGGVCVNCKNYTTGRFCDTCLPNYFRPNGTSLYDPAVCQPCDCSPTAIIAECSKVGGQCTCRANVEGRRCDTCKAGFYGLSVANADGCLPCNCNMPGAEGSSLSCDQTSGQCKCKANVRGLRCDECAFGYFGLAANNSVGCSPCNCNAFGSSSIYCNSSSGQCQCKERVNGLKCDTCKDGYHNFTNGCVACSCNVAGTEAGTVCDKVSGQCTCKQNVQGVYCDQCKDGTYNFGSLSLEGCQRCPCFLDGTVNGTGSCDKISGTCLCKANVEGQGCNKCKPNTWGLNATDPIGCQLCDCDPLGTLLENRTVCDQNTGQCPCLSNRVGRRCDACRNGTYVNPNGGCLACDCHPMGTLNGTSCNAVTGQCECKQGDFGVTGKNCDQCMPTFFDFNARLGSCNSCKCLEAGSLNTTCDFVSGQCQCKTFVTGLACDRCRPGSSNLDANNPYGCSSAPSQQPPPQFSNRTSTSITLVWGVPDSQNGVLSGYNIYRNDTIVGNTSASVLTYEDNNLQPFTYYKYEIEVLNAISSVRSTPVVFQTLAGKPSNDMVLNVSDIRARSVLCTWTSPSNMNGPLLKYVIQSVRASPNTTVQQWEGTVLSTTLTTLSPYTQYTLTVQACTVGGCADSVGVNITTLSAPPEGQQPPVITPLSSSELMVSWLHPSLPNGIIIYYELWFRGPIGADGQHNPNASRVSHPSGRYDPLAPPGSELMSPPATSYNMSGLLAFTTYEFQVLSENDAGKAASTWAQGRTLEALPISIGAPSVTGVSSFELLVSWITPPPADVQGLVTTYRLYQNIPGNLTQDPFGPPYTWKLVYEGDGSILSKTVSGLTPYSEHSFILEACNSKGCINSSAVSGRTLVAAPEGVQKPTASGFNTTVMEIQWNQPQFPNGPSPLYKVQKTNIALSYPASVVRGTRLTGGGYYAFPPSVLPQNVAFTGIRFRFRLDRGTGMLLFSGTYTQEEFIVIQFVSGRPWFMFDTQGCQNTGFVTTTNDEGLVYNDRKWHFFEARRNGGYGTVTVDDGWKGESSMKDPACINASIIGPTTAVYVGGFPPDFIVRRSDRTRRVETTPLQGCVDKIEILQQIYPEEMWTPLNWTQGLTNDLEFLNWQGCPINLEPGFHFLGKGYLVLSNCEDNKCFVSGNTIHVRFRVRTELRTGLLFLLYGGTGIYMYSVLDNGQLKFVISNSATRTQVTYDDPNETFCDGKWRQLSFDKVGQQASISGPSLKTFSVGDPNVEMSLALVSDIFLGGLQDGSAAKKYVIANSLQIPDEGFGGCFSEFQINDKLYDTDMIVVNVANTNLDGCPPYYNSTNTCQSSVITQVYQGMDMVAFDTGLLPYTDYIYRVTASNEGGEGVSSWSYGRTTEGAPSGVKGPISLRAINGSEIEVVWEEPQTTYGLLTKFVVMAYDMDNNETFVSRDINDVSVTAVNMTGVTPDTNYLVKIVACTNGGCTESDDGMDVMTPIEAPEDVPAPSAEAGPTYLDVQWSTPLKSNGPITGYVLYQDGKEVYNGGQLSFNVTALQVYTAYNFYISACTSAGCTSGPTVALSTFQMAPTFVDKPTLVVLDTSRIKATWDIPTILNGVLQSFLLYASTVLGDLGQAIYNTTDLRPDYTIEDLQPGTTYYITLAACTAGGCTLGLAANATTEESSPSGVPTPVVTPTSPSSLQVTWGNPLIPNGQILRYDLYHNGVLVYSGLNQTYMADRLLPYSQHTFYVTACTAEGCAASDQVVAWTLETAPEGFIVLNATVVDARSVNVTWTLPANLNGNLTFRVYFTGLFYVNPVVWNYSTVVERRQLLASASGYTVYQVRPLVPMSNYSVQVNGSNSVGFIASNILEVQMPPSTPDGMAPPILISETSTSIKVTWSPVGRENAPEAVAYLLQFMESTPSAMIQDEFGPTVTLSYTKINLQPFTEYRFRVVATNSYGQTQSSWVSLVTKQDKPASMNVPLVIGLKARYVDITWSDPLAKNGVITQFNIYVNTTLRTSATSNMTSMRIDNLLPFTDYTFVVEACTITGCTSSAPSATVRTLEDLAEDLHTPVFTTLSPVAVRIMYMEPGQPNGVISQYIIERKDGQSENITLVTTRGAEMEKTYVDQSNELLPFYIYSYRVNVQNGAGIANGSFVQTTTGSSNPAGVNPPQITSISPFSVQVKWLPPLQPNGQIEMYVLRFPDPRIEVRNTTVLSLVVNDLKAFTQYDVTLTACTSAGCTESAPTNFTTDPSIPSEQAAPDPTAISQSRISIIWQPPASPNGPNIKYELSRMKVAQPLDPAVGDIGVWQSLNSSVGLFYEDVNLPMFTTYVYRVAVFNDNGQTISPNSTLVTTFGGFPRLPANVTAVALDHLSIYVNWTVPSPVELQGQVQNLTLQAVTNSSTKTQYPDVTNVSSVVGGLEPNTLYSLTLTITIYGGANITSQPVMVTTKDGAPSGLNPPQLFVVSQTALRVSWTSPAQPNGEIISYRILVNDRQIDTGSRLPGSAVVDQLQPYTVYDIRIEACTVLTCTVSPSALGTTAEAVPQGMAPPIATSSTATEVIVTWKSPDIPNGIIQRYDVWRKSLENCADVPAPTTNPDPEKCTYVECGILENLCGSTCYPGASVCCNGVMYDSTPNYDCCGIDYVLKPGANYICCSGQFYEPRTNYQCCGQRYVEVLPGDTCCPESLEDRVSISQGDSCCGTVPFMSSGAQMCCQGSLANKLGSKCCGGAVISDTTTCCGNADAGQMYLQKPGFTCCGQDYVQASITLCCSTSAGQSTVHLYGSEQEKLTAFDTCCGLNRITRNLACCNYVGYNQLTQICADMSKQDNGCGTGVVCPISQQNSAFCNRCDFDNSTLTCSSVKSYQDEPPTTSDPNSSCTTETVRIYSGLNFTYTDSTLSPYSQYEYSVTAVSSAGSATSNYTTIRTLEAVPDVVHPPSTKIAPEELYAIYLTWLPPEKPNGLITGYILKRDGIELYRGLDKNLTDNLNILPYQSYSYILSACTSVGCANSSLVNVATAQAAPEDLLPPLVEVVNSTTIKVNSQSPGKPNGVIISYSVILMDMADYYNSTAPQEFIISDLAPFTSYTLEMEVCTVVGCTTSPNITVTTLEDLPQGLAPPRVIVVSSTSVELHWRGPNVTNGIITNFKVIQTQPAPVTEVYIGLATAQTLLNLVPSQAYTYQLQATNGAGSIVSDPREIIMPSVAPANVPPPQIVKALSSTSIRVQWLPLSSTQLDIDQYRVLLNVGQENEVERGVGLQTSVTIPDLQPYTRYEVRLQACLRNVLNGCGTSGAVLVTTNEDKPLGMMSPDVTAVASNTVNVAWKPPSQPNGVITVYRIYEQQPSKANSEILINQVPGGVLGVLHSGPDLQPYQVYEYKIIAVNSVGEIASNWSSVRTLESPPAGLSAPVISNVSTYGISLFWTFPANPNGVIREYRIVYQLGASGSQTLQQKFVSVTGNVTNTFLSGLQAYSAYILYLEAVNGAGSVRSSSVSFTTKEGYPSGLSDFAVEKITAGTSVILSWNEPAKTNGIIATYRVYESSYLVAIYSGIARTFEFRRLSPYTKYFVKLEACTRVGCTLGRVQSFYTAEVAPTSQPSPTFGTVNNTHVHLYWQPILSANGAITYYAVLRSSNALRRKRDVSSILKYLSFSDFQMYSDLFTNSSEECQVKHNGSKCPSDDEFAKSTHNDISQTFDSLEMFLDHPDETLTGRHKRQSSTPSNYQIVYKTTDTEQSSYDFVDSGLQPYNEYQYSIRAANAIGYTDSPWQTIRTDQAAPESVQPPVLSLINNSINSINISWSPPDYLNGVLQSFQLQRNETVPFSFPADTNRNFIDTGLVAFTTYSYKLTVCTGGGCSTSQPATIRTLEAAPLFVSPPILTAINSTFMRVTWSMPQISNGMIIRFRLKMDGKYIYSGLLELVILTDLVPYQAHVFTITACTNGGCTESAEVTGRTEEAPPTGLSPPLLRVMSSRSIEITWSPPVGSNGVISSYDVKRDGRLIFTTSMASGGTPVTSYVDYSLEPGLEYSYTIVARNGKGSTESGPAKAMTYSASPTGLAAPLLTPISPTSIRVDWSSPDSPNGVLTNYSIYEGNNRIYFGVPSQLSYTVPGLQSHTLYTFSVEACTDRGCQISQSSQSWTLPATPENQPSPSLVALADEQGANAGIRLSWDPPAKPNGDIAFYELYRRDVTNGAAMMYGDPSLVYNGSSRTYTDNSTQLQPYQPYQYMVIASNTVGKIASPWAEITTKEAPPEGILPPRVNSSTATTITVSVTPPVKPNGIIQLYIILVNDSKWSSSPSLQQTVGTFPQLTPYTTYELKTQACTMAGCATSSGVTVVTDSDIPAGLAAIKTVVVNNSRIDLLWVSPSRPNGQIIRYEVYIRTSCPPTQQPFIQDCTLGDRSTIYSGPNMAFTADNLKSYTAYDFQLQVFNDKGPVDDPVWVKAETTESGPIYSQTPRLHKNGTLAVINWGSSFTLNGRLNEYILLVDGEPVFTGITSEKGVERDAKNQVFSFIVEVTTNSGQAQSPAMLFDPDAVDNIGTTTPPPVPLPVNAAGTPFYQEIWFIVLMCIIGMIILFVVLALCIWRCCSRRPYQRERMPLHRRRQDKLTQDLYVVDSRDGSVIHENGLTSAKLRNRDNFYQGPGVGVINPAFSQDGELARMSPGKMSWPSGKYIGDDDDLQWGRHFDSGLFDDLDDDSNSGQTYSYTKEQTVFTDTHL